MVYDLTPTGAESEATLTVDNTTQTVMTIEVIASEIEVSTSGDESRVLAEDAFVIFPPTAVVQPGGSQSIRVKYVGNPDLQVSKSYRVSVNQLPVELGESDSAVGVVVNFSTLANVVPTGAVPEPLVKSFLAEEGGDNTWIVRIENAGSRYIRLATTEWVFTDRNGKTRSLLGPELTQAIKGGLVLPNSIREVHMQAIDGYSPSNTDLSIRVRD